MNDNNSRGRREDEEEVIYQSSVDPWLVWIHNHFCYFRFPPSLLSGAREVLMRMKSGVFDEYT